MADQTGDRVAVNTGRLWGGGMATAGVAALVAFVGSLIARGIFDIPFLAPEREGVLGGSSNTAFVVMVGLGGVFATLLLQVLILVSPAPMSFYSWMAGLMTVAMALLPFTTEADLRTKFASGLVNFFVGLVYLTLLPRVAATAIEEAPSTQFPTGPI